MIKSCLTSLRLKRNWFSSILLSLGLFLLVTLPAYATGVYDIPNLSADQPNWIVDQADVISFANEKRLSGNLEKLAEETGNEVRMVVIRRLDYGETIDSFADKLVSKWFATPEAQSHQTVIVLDSLTNNATIRRGESVKEIMPDAIAQSVIDETMGIPVRDDKYNQALLDASNRLVAVLSGQPDPGAPQVRDTLNIEGTFTKAEDTDQGSSTIWVIGLLIVATVIPMVTYFLYVGFPG